MFKVITQVMVVILWVVKISHPQFIHSIYPEQIHLSISENPQEMIVTWITFADTKNSFVWYGARSEGLNSRAEGSSNEFTDFGRFRTVRYVHRVVLPNLEPLTFYEYRCGSWFGLSETFVFKMRPKGIHWSPRLIIFGDMGWKGAGIFPYLQNEANKFGVDAIFHVGDMAYNMENYDGIVGDEFLRMIQPVASCIPYMTIVGNHEQAYNFLHYRKRFSMPGPSEGMFYSVDLGPAHLIAISSEVYYFPEYGYQPLVDQYNWLQQDLKEATGPENRHQRPWIIVFAHRPMYCSSDTGEDCSFTNNVLKCFCFDAHNYGLETLLHQNKVDLLFSGHMHYYERSWPIYQNEVYNGSNQQPYRNARAIVHIITGAAGMQGGTETASYIRRDWFPFFSSDYSYTVMTVQNKTHILLEQISASKEGQVIDSIWLIKDGLF